MSPFLYLLGLHIEHLQQLLTSSPKELSRLNALGKEPRTIYSPARQRESESDQTLRHSFQEIQRDYQPEKTDNKLLSRKTRVEEIP